MANDENRCKKKVKDDNGKIHECGTHLPKGHPTCKNRREHMLPAKSGFCSAGFHEGIEAKDWKGNYVRTCPLWKMCPCECHITIDKMSELAGIERRLLENPKYIKPKSQFVMPDFHERDVESLEIQNKPVLIKQSPIEVAIPQKVYHETETGKRQKGQLEQQVLLVCTAFVKGQIDVEYLTPAFIAKDIDEVSPPSVGAIGAVFDRWVSIGFANCERKPVRFVSFTSEGLANGLDYMKEKAKKMKKAERIEKQRPKFRAPIQKLQ